MVLMSQSLEHHSKRHQFSIMFPVTLFKAIQLGSMQICTIDNIAYFSFFKFILRKSHSMFITQLGKVQLEGSFKNIHLTISRKFYFATPLYWAEIQRWFPE